MPEISVRSELSGAGADWRRVLQSGYWASLICGFVFIAATYCFSSQVGPGGTPYREPLSAMLDYSCDAFLYLNFLFVPFPLGYLLGMDWKRIPEPEWVRHSRRIHFTNCVYAASGPLLLAGSSACIIGWTEFSGKLALLVILLVMAAASLIYGVQFGRDSGSAPLERPAVPRPAAPTAQAVEIATPDDGGMMPPLPVMRPTNWRGALWLGHLFSLASAFISTEVCLQIGNAIAEFPSHSAAIALFDSCGNAMLFLSCFGIPCGIGFASAYFWRDVPETEWRKGCAGWIYANHVCALVGASFVVGPGIFCSFPVLLMMQALGIYNGYYFWRERPIFGASPNREPK